MPFSTPNTNPLTTTQSELTARIGSMKSLLEIPFVDFNNIPKSKQVSTSDYLLRILNTLGLNPKFVFQQFIAQVLDTSGNFLENAVIEASATQLMYTGVQLPGGTFNLGQTTAQQRQTIINQNKSFISARVSQLGLTNFLQTAKQQIAKDLTLSIFGPKDGAAAEYLNPNPSERERIISESICAVNAFSMSNDGFERNEDVEYNRIALARQLERGEVILEISCQQVKVRLPEDPSWIFEGGGTQTIGSSPTTPAQSLDILATYVESTAQQINNEQNTKSAGKTFQEILVERMISTMTFLLYPYIGTLIAAFETDLPDGVNVNADTLVTSTCEIQNQTSSNPNKKRFGESIANQLYKKLVSLLLIVATREFKKLVKNYFARIARERARRKLEKNKARFALVEDVAEEAEKAARLERAYAALEPILSGNQPI